MKIDKAMKMNLIGLPVFALSLLLDIVSKILIERHVGVGQHIDFLGGFLRITLVYNTGGVFGIMQGYKTVFLVVSIVVLLLMGVYYFLEKNKTLPFTLAMSLIMGGAVGNIIDRLVPGRIGVVDFISMGIDGIYRWPTYNIADSSIVVGAFLLVYVFYTEERKRKLAEEQQARESKETK